MSYTHESGQPNSYGPDGDRTGAPRPYVNTEYEQAGEELSLANRNRYGWLFGPRMMWTILTHGPDAARAQEYAADARLHQAHEAYVQAAAWHFEEHAHAVRHNDTQA